MNREQMKALIVELIALCQRNDLLPTESDELADELQALISNEVYISKCELDYFVS